MNFNKNYELFKMKLKANGYTIRSFALAIQENESALNEKINGRRGRENKENIKNYLEKLNDLVK